MDDFLYAKVRTESILYGAWRSIYQNGISSKSKSTRDSVTQFELNHRKEIATIAKELRTNSFYFLPATGIPVSKPGKTSLRPIVISEVRDRIVQRAILDVLQAHPPVKKYINVETSFGGIKDRGVPKAIRLIYEKAQTGGDYYIRSDIESFFTQIPQKKVITILSGLINDNAFLDLFSRAIDVELKNLASLGADSSLFPLHDIGVAQGSCLSPFIGNLLLHDFDIQTNKGNVTCVRYVDDFILLAPTRKEVNEAFKNALDILGHDGLTAYDPNINGEKAKQGTTKRMYTMLGCDIRPGMIKPSKKAKKGLVMSVREVLQNSQSLMTNPKRLLESQRTVIQTLNTVSNIKKGWGNQYSFCNDMHEMRNLDKEIDTMVKKYLSDYKGRKDSFVRAKNRDDATRLLGIHMLIDSKYDPIVI